MGFEILNGFESVRGKLAEVSKIIGSVPTA
jgi:hypothetical protein